MSSRIAKLLIISTFLIFSFFNLTACDSGHDHVDAFGIVILAGDEQLAIQEFTEITYADGNSITLTEGETTPVLSVKFLNEDGSFFVPEDDSYFLEWAISNTNVLSMQPIQGAVWDFTATAESVGQAQVVFDLIHVDHSDYTSLPFLFEVVAEAEED